MSRIQTFIDWTQTTRQVSPLFDNDADALLTRLQALHAQQQALQQAQRSPVSIALYGSSQGAKAHLLGALCANGQGRLMVRAGNKTFDYFSHINPGHALTRMALRFSREAPPPDDAFPLRLHLMSETDLVQLFIAHALRQGAVHQVDKAVVATRLNTWQALRQSQPVAGVSGEDVAALARFWQGQVPARQQQFDDALWQQFIQLIPCLDLSARASAWALLWGEQQELTRQWLALAHVLQQCGHAGSLAAPLSLLVDGFALPAEGFLTPEYAPEGEVLVHPLAGEHRLNAVSLPLDALALLTRELVLPVENGVLENVDLLDIPVPELTDATPLWASKCHWLLDSYRQRCQPDLLMVCNAVTARSQIPTTARRLLQWVEDTQPQQDGALPGLVWVITPQDDRFVHKRNLDEAVQQLIGKPGQRWGTLQALDSSSLQRLIEWLSQATVPTQRQSRLQLQDARLQLQAQRLMSAWKTPASGDAAHSRAQAENVVRELQKQAATLGELLEGLLPAQQYFEQLCQIQPPREEKVSALFNDSVDLFALPDESAFNATGQQDRGFAAHALWVSYLRQWSRREDNARRYGLTPQTLQQLAEILIVTSYRLELPQQLQVVMRDERASPSQLRAMISNYLAWLGYASVPPQARPASRVAKGSTLFAAGVSSTERLTALGENPAHAATRYVYDWLVALFTRACEAPDYRHPLDIPDDARAALNALF